MKTKMQIALLGFFFLVVSGTMFAQEITAGSNDLELKETLYKKYKKEVLGYDKNDFDTLFFEFFKKSKDKSQTLTKEEFYTYTIKIAIYSERLGLLYKDRKAESERTKQDWFDKSYADYLKSKN
ncbi:hypothetical protein [Flavobacterium sp.]